VDRFTPERLAAEANVAMVVRPDGKYVRYDDAQAQIQEIALQALSSEGQWIDKTGELSTRIKKLEEQLREAREYLHDAPATGVALGQRIDQLLGETR